MPKSTKAKLEYMAEYQKRPENVDKRVERNRARREALRDGAVKKGDNKDVDHKQMLDRGGSHTKDNRRVVDASTNRGWRKRDPGAYGR
jgi:hypothetical protein